jgi:hypothetical protein
MPNLASRSTREVFDDHLKLAQEGRFEEDITRNFSEDCVVLTNRGTFRGHDGLRQLAAMWSRKSLALNTDTSIALSRAVSRCSNGLLTAPLSPCMMARIPSSSRTARSSRRQFTTR